MAHHYGIGEKPKGGKARKLWDWFSRTMEQDGAFTLVVNAPVSPGAAGGRDAWLAHHVGRDGFLDRRPGPDRAADLRRGLAAHREGKGVRPGRRVPGLGGTP